MKRLILAVPALIATAMPSLAHEALAPHAHPHADWGLAATALLIAGLGAALMALPRLMESLKRKDRK